MIIYTIIHTKHNYRLVKEKKKKCIYAGVRGACVIPLILITV